MRLSRPMLRGLLRVHFGQARYLSDIPTTTRRALESRLLLGRHPYTKRALLLRDGQVVVDGALAMAENLHPDGLGPWLKVF